MATSFDLGPAQAEFQERDSFDNNGVVPRFLAGLIQFLAQSGKRLGTEYYGEFDLLGGGFVHQRF
jgi:hypothetical protein